MLNFKSNFHSVPLSVLVGSTIRSCCKPTRCNEEFVDEVYWPPPAALTTPTRVLVDEGDLVQLKKKPERRGTGLVEHNYVKGHEEARERHVRAQTFTYDSGLVEHSHHTTKHQS